MNSRAGARATCGRVINMAYQTKEEAKAASKARRNAATNAGLIDIQIQYRAVGDLALDPRNPRQHSQRQVNQIADSIRELPAAQTSLDT